MQLVCREREEVVAERKDLRYVREGGGGINVVQEGGQMVPNGLIANMGDSVNVFL